MRERADVVAEARNTGVTLHLGHLAGICVEKNSQLPEGHPLRKFKGRVVFLGDQVRNQDFEAAIFQDLGSAPATMEASRACDFYGCGKGHSVATADARQSYIQAALKGPTTWISIPREYWPAEWSGMSSPVVQLEQALYGHPNSGS